MKYTQLLAQEFLKFMLKVRNISLKEVVLSNISDGGLKPNEKNKFLNDFYFKKCWQDVQDSTIKNYIKINAERKTLNDIYGKIPEMIFFTEDDNKILFNNPAQAWEDFKQKYPKSSGIIDVSAPGFSDDEKEAIIYIGKRWGNELGNGHYYLYKFEDNHWKQMSSVLAWMTKPKPKHARI